VLFAITVLHGILSAALIGSLGWAILEVTRIPQTRSTARARRAAAAALASALLVNATGVYSYIVSCLLPPARTASALLIQAPWTHRVLLETMVYAGLFIPIIPAVALAVLGSFHRQLPDDEAAFAPLGHLLYVALAMVLLLAIAGFVPSLIDFAS